MEFKEEKEFLNRFEDSANEVNKKTIITIEKANQLIEQYPNIPKGYIDYLLEIGAGVIREMQFDVKAFLFDFSDLGLEGIFNVDEEVKFFGDNLSGDFAGFDFSKENTDEVVEFWHDSNEVYYTGKTFREYIRERMLMKTSTIRSL